MRKEQPAPARGFAGRRARWGSSDRIALTFLVIAVGLVVVPSLGGPTPAVAGPARAGGVSTRLTAGITHGSAPIPAFSRMYETACSTCHTAAPKLNVLGEVFRLNGYRMPDSELLRKDDPVSLGAPEWDQAWPRAIRSSDLPGIVPVALRVVSDLELTRDERTPYGASYRFPHEVRVLAAAPLGDDVAAFLNAGWSSERGFGVSEARIDLEDPLPGLPNRLLDLRIGLQNPLLLTFGDHHIDQAARQTFGWQWFRASDVEVESGRGGGVPVSLNGLALGSSQAAVEVNGLVGERLYYGAGVAQGVSDGPTDANDRKDAYYKIRYKLGGISLRGHYDQGDEPTLDVPGQLLDRSLILETFGYFGNEARDDASEAEHRAFGAAARTLFGRLDLGVGYVVRDFERPWPQLQGAEMTTEALFGKAEYILLPWVIGSLKAEWLDVSVEGLPVEATVVPPSDEATRILPGVVLLLRQNVRLVAEGDLFLQHPATELRDLGRPHALWMRLDVAF